MDNMCFCGFIQALECQRERLGRWFTAHRLDRITKDLADASVMHLAHTISTEFFDSLFGNRHEGSILYFLLVGQGVKDYNTGDETRILADFYKEGNDDWIRRSRSCIHGSGVAFFGTHPRPALGGAV